MILKDLDRESSETTAPRVVMPSRAAVSAGWDNGSKFGALHAASADSRWPALALLQNDRLQFGMATSSIARQTFAESVFEGLSAPARWLGCSWFYDRRGSELFEEICELPEYYLTRVESGILEAHREEIARFQRAGAVLPHSPATLVELGSGSSAKTRILIEAFEDAQHELTYCPIDISPEMLYSSALNLLNRFPRLRVRAIAADYIDGLTRIELNSAAPRLILFLGSTIGNFGLSDATEFLRKIRLTMSPGDCLLLGADLKKEPAVLEAAYADSQGVTAAFNKNILARVNRELGGRFDLEAFEHRAVYLPEPGRVEMRLVSKRDQTIPVLALQRSFSFAAGEWIHTESCHKYSLDQLGALADAAGLSIRSCWQDPRGWFTLLLLEPA
ncbi:MAG TPA: L-histidine N(alpha)-methyltransferase [Armatimonadota bacterium]|nr:L-histidine N(alpha)-methyltransferase [Armatimonadota bacterium]